ncbi:MAG: S9 family peptidase, partial [Pseudomonadota bacterium]
MTDTTPPIAEKRTSTSTWHGVELVDDYAWLRAENWMEVMRDPSKLQDDIRAHLEAENAHTEAWLKPTETLQATLFDEMKGRIKEDDSSVPQPDGDWLYYSRYETGQQYPVFCRAPRTQVASITDETVLLDGNREADGKEYWKLGGLGHSPNHALMYYSVDENGSELFKLRIRDLASGR